jgi:hypothetical protein
VGVYAYRNSPSYVLLIDEDRCSDHVGSAAPGRPRRVPTPGVPAQGGFWPREQVLLSQIALAAARAVHAIHGPELPYFALERGKTTPVITQILTGGLIEESLETQLPARFSLVPVQDRILNPTRLFLRI